MVTRMVRKQINIHQRQNALLKRLVQERGLSEAEIIRQAIDHEIGRGRSKTFCRRSHRFGGVRSLCNEPS